MQCWVDYFIVRVLFMLNNCQSSMVGKDMTKINLGLIVDLSDNAQKVCKLWVAKLVAILDMPCY